jgi:hypothetical protein
MPSHREIEKPTSETIGFRLDSTALLELRRLSKERKISLNALISGIIDNYLKRGVYDKTFGFFSIDKDMLKVALEKLKDDELAKIAEIGGARIHRQIIMYLYGKVNKETVTDYLDIFGNRFESFRHFSEGRKNTITVFHALNRQFSILYYDITKSILSLAGIEAIENERSITEEGFSIVFEL